MVLAPAIAFVFQEGQATKKEEGLDSLEGHDDALGDFGMGEDLIGELGEDININDFANLFDGPEGEIPAGGASSASGLITDSIFFMIPLCKKPSSGKYFSLPFLPATPSSPPWTLEGLFELTRHPSRALNHSSHLPSGKTEIQGHGHVC